MEPVIRVSSLSNLPEKFSSKQLAHCIEQASSKVEAFISVGNVVREAHCEGCKNSSAALTIEGTMAAGQTLADLWKGLKVDTEEPSVKVNFWGGNLMALIDSISETISEIKKEWNKK